MNDQTRSVRFTGGGLRILLVDDNQHLLVLVSQMILQLWRNAQLEVASGGIDALKKAAAAHFDVVITDMEMPDLNGYDMAAAIRVLPEPTCKAKILLITGGTISAEKLQQSGIDDYLLKPFNVDALRNKVQSLTSQSPQDNL